MGKALVNRNKLLLIQGPPGKTMTLYYCNTHELFTGTGKSKTCVELIKQFIDLNEVPPAEGPAVLYCAPSNKAVNVGACKHIVTAISHLSQCIC